MKVLIIGNIASGKSTLITSLRVKFPNWGVAAIDDFRVEYSDGTITGECLARSYFYKAINNTDSQFIECVGIGEVFREVHRYLGQCNAPILVVVVKCKLKICVERLQQRKSNIPFPHDFKRAFDMQLRASEALTISYIKEHTNDFKDVAVLEVNNNIKSDLDRCVNLATKMIDKTIRSEWTSTNFDAADLMRSKDIQKYYGYDYMVWQRAAIQNNQIIQKDIETVQALLKRYINGIVVDCGSGDCQWFENIEQLVTEYRAIDINGDALKKCENLSKVKIYQEDIFNLTDQHPVFTDADCAIFSYFLSHFSDSQIKNVLQLVKNINTIIIIDSILTPTTCRKLAKQQLSIIHRRTSETAYVTLPKRYFSREDCSNLFATEKKKLVEVWVGNYIHVSVLKHHNC